MHLTDSGVPSARKGRWRGCTPRSWVPSTRECPGAFVHDLQIPPAAPLHCTNWVDWCAVRWCDKKHTTLQYNLHSS